MNNVTKWFLLSIAFAIFIYLTFSFGNWQLNPGLWSPEARALCGMSIFLTVTCTNIFANINPPQ